MRFAWEVLGRWRYPENPPTNYGVLGSIKKGWSNDPLLQYRLDNDSYSQTFNPKEII